MYDDGNIYVDRQVLAVKVGYYCSIVVGLRDSEACNGVLHQIATSRQMATEHHDHDIDVEGCNNFYSERKETKQR